MKNKKQHLSGPMAGYADLNFPAFHNAARTLREKGYSVFNPAELGDQGSYRANLRANLLWICDHADTMAMLPNWEKSKEATAEHALAIALELDFIYL